MLWGFSVIPKFFFGTKTIGGITGDAFTNGEDLVLLSYDYIDSPWDSNAHELSHININRGRLATMDADSSLLWYVDAKACLSATR